MAKRDKNWDLKCPEDCEGCSRTRREVYKECLKMFKEAGKSENPKDEICGSILWLQDKIKRIKK